MKRKDKDTTLEDGLSSANWTSRELKPKVQFIKIDPTAAFHAVFGNPIIAPDMQRRIVPVKLDPKT